MPNGTLCLAVHRKNLKEYSLNSEFDQDRRPLTLNDLIEPPPPTELTQAAPKIDDETDFSALRTGSSAKIDQLIHLLKLTPPTEKSLVFSQFTTFLDKVRSCHPIRLENKQAGSSLTMTTDS